METTWWPRGRQEGINEGVWNERPGHFPSAAADETTSPPTRKSQMESREKVARGGKAAYFPLWESGQEGRSGPTTPRSTRREIEISAGQDYQFGPRAYRTGSICLRPTIPRRSCKCSAPWSTLSKFRRPVKQGSMSSHSPDGPRQDMDRSRQVMSRGS